MTEQTEREVLEALFHKRFPEPEMVGAPLSDERLAWHAAFKPWAAVRERFTAMLDAGAYLDAALMLVPEGWSWSIANRQATHSELPVNAQLWNSQPASTIHGDASTPALALAAAIQRTGDGADR